MHNIHGHPDSITFGGESYTFTHLHPTTVTFKLASNVALLAECRFKSHCYTREVDAAEDVTELIKIPDDLGNVRYFCPTRYALSTELVGWISAWCHEKCIQGKNYQHGVENWIVVQVQGGQHVKVAFSAEKHQSIVNGLLLWIKTVHPYDRSTPPVATRENSVPFNTLAKTVAYSGAQPKVSKARKHR